MAQKILVSMKRFEAYFADTLALYGFVFSHYLYRRDVLTSWLFGKCLLDSV